MTGGLRVTPLARADIAEASAWYAAKGHAVALAFQDAVAETFTRIEANPLHAREIAPGIRRRVMRGWPYNVWYAPRSVGPIVFAVLSHRRPQDLALVRAIGLP